MRRHIAPPSGRRLAVARSILRVLGPPPPCGGTRPSGSGSTTIRSGTPDCAWPNPARDSSLRRPTATPVHGARANRPADQRHPGRASRLVRRDRRQRPDQARRIALGAIRRDSSLRRPTATPSSTIRCGEQPRPPAPSRPAPSFPPRPVGQTRRPRIGPPPALTDRSTRRVSAWAHRARGRLPRRAAPRVRGPTPPPDPARPGRVSWLRWHASAAALMSTVAEMATAVSGSSVPDR